MGLRDVFLKTSIIKSFKLSDAIKFSYFRDLRFAGYVLSTNIPSGDASKPEAVVGPLLCLLLCVIVNLLLRRSCNISPSTKRIELLRR